MTTSCCIRNNCGMPYDMSAPEGRDTKTLRAFWQRYCPKHRVREDGSEVIVGNPVTEPKTKLGTCRDCSQDSRWSSIGPGFAQYVEDGKLLHWYCLYCGSNHVDIRDAEGKTVYSGGDLYGEDV